MIFLLTEPLSVKYNHGNLYGFPSSVYNPVDFGSGQRYGEKNNKRFESG